MTLEHREQGQSPVTDDVQKNRLIQEKSPYLLQHATNPCRLVSLGRRSILPRSTGR